MNFTFPRRVLFVIPLVVLFVILIPLVITIIDAGKIGVVSTFGQVANDPLYPGLHVKNPFSSVIPLSTRTEEYTMSASKTEGKIQGDDSVEARASDGALVYLDVTVLFHINPGEGPRIYRDLGEDFEAKIIRPEIRSTIREGVSKYSVNEVYTTKREELAALIKDKITSAVTPRGIVIEEILLRDVKLTKTLADSIEQKLTAQQEAQKLDFLLEKEKKEAERKVIEAKGQQQAQQLISQGLTNQYLYYLYITTLKDRQGTIYVPTEGGVPLFKMIP